MCLPALYHGRCKGLSIAEGSIRHSGPWGTKIEHSALSDQRTPQSPAPQHPSGVRQAPRVFCGAFVFRNRGEVFFGTSTFHNDFTKAGGPLPKRRWDRLWRPACVLEPSARTPANLGPDHSSGRDLFRQGRRPARPPPGDHVALVQLGLTNNQRKTAPISYHLPLESK
jgi:hypothetical protein